MLGIPPPSASPRGWEPVSRVRVLQKLNGSTRAARSRPPALNIIQNAIINGHLANGKRLLDSTSGNMGISYATFGRRWDSVTLALPANASPGQRISILKARRGTHILTDPLEGSDGAIMKARELAAEFPDKYWYANQYSNEANWRAHYVSTGPEIVRQQMVRSFIAGLGTSGTFTGTSRYLNDQLPHVKTLPSSPDAPFHGLEG